MAGWSRSSMLRYDRRKERYRTDTTYATDTFLGPSRGTTTKLLPTFHFGLERTVSR